MAYANFNPKKTTEPRWLWDSNLCLQLADCPDGNTDGMKPGT